MFLSAEWIRIISQWAGETPEVRGVTAYGSRVTGARRLKADPSPEPELDLAVETVSDETGNALGHFMALSGSWALQLEDRLGVKVDLRHHDPLDPEDDVSAYLAAGSRKVWP